jgi:hypothetical protein
MLTNKVLVLQNENNELKSVQVATNTYEDVKEESGWGEDLLNDNDEKLQDLQNENFTLKQEIEAVKAKAYAMLESKDKEIDRIKSEVNEPP